MCVSRFRHVVKERSVINDNIKIVFGTRVRAYRKLRHLTQKQLAAAMGKTVDTVSNIERGTNSATIDTANHVANALDVELWELFRYPPPSAEEETKRQLIEKFLEFTRKESAK